MSELETARHCADTPSSSLPDLNSVFPSELHDYILDYLHNDRHTLSACTLVCRTWHASSTYHLFQNASTVRVHPSNLRQFCQLLSSQRLNTSIGRLHLRSGSHDAAGGTQDTFRFNDHLEHFKSLSNVKYLRVTDHTRSISTRFTAVVPNLSTITHLELDLSFDLFAHFLQLIGTLPFLRGLALHEIFNMADLDSEGEAQTYAAAPSNLETVVMGDYPVTPQLRWLHFQPCIRRLAIGKLNYSFASPLRQRSRITLVSDFLRIVGPRLEHLVISTRFLTSAFDLTHSTGLRSLRINGIQSCGPRVLDLLCRIRSRVLERIVFVVDLRMKVGLDGFDWPCIAGALAGIEGLRWVEFSLSSRAECAAIKEMLGTGGYVLQATSWEDAERPRSNYGLEIFDA